MDNQLPFETQRRDEDGQKYIFRTDSESEFIKHILKELLEDYGIIAADVSVNEGKEGWMHIELRFDPKIPSDEALSDLQTALLVSIGGGKGWYECEDSGETENTMWWVTRHVRGPYI